MFSADHGALVEFLVNNLSEEITTHCKGGQLAYVCRSRMIIFVTQSMWIREVRALIKLHELRVLVHFSHECHYEKMVV